MRAGQPQQCSRFCRAAFKHVKAYPLLNVVVFSQLEAECDTLRDLNERVRRAARPLRSDINMADLEKKAAKRYTKGVAKQRMIGNLLGTSGSAERAYASVRSDYDSADFRRAVVVLQQDAEAAAEARIAIDQGIAVRFPLEACQSVRLFVPSGALDIVALVLSA